MNPMMNPMASMMGMGGLGGAGILGGLDPGLLGGGMGGSAGNGSIIDMMDDPDHLVETKHRIDDYLTKQYKLGKRKLSVQVNYGNMPLEYQFLQQYHGFKNPLVGTPLAHRFGLPGPRPGYRNRRPGSKNKTPMFSRLPSSWNQPGYGAPPQPGYGAPPQPGYGAPPPQPQGYGPPPSQGYGPPPS